MTAWGSAAASGFRQKAWPYSRWWSTPSIRQSRARKSHSTRAQRTLPKLQPANSMRANGEQLRGRHMQKGQIRNSVLKRHLRAVFLLCGMSPHVCSWHLADMPAYPPDVRFRGIVLQKSFGGDERNFLGPLMRFARRDVREHIAY